jgi:hypothetical protein
MGNRSAYDPAAKEFDPQRSGDQPEVRSSRLVHWSRTSSASCIHVPGAFNCGGMAVVKRRNNA